MLNSSSSDSQHYHYSHTDRSHVQENGFYHCCDKQPATVAPPPLARKYPHTPWNSACHRLTAQIFHDFELSNNLVIVNPYIDKNCSSSNWLQKFPYSSFSWLYSDSPCHLTKSPRSVSCCLANVVATFMRRMPQLHTEIANFTFVVVLLG